MEPEKKRAIEWIDDQSDRLINISQEIWDFAELGLEEFKSSALLVKVLRDVGFNVEEGVSGMPTAFVATWGEGKPNIGILAEYDALPQCAVDGDGPGHGCGHNLLGTSSVAAAIAVKTALEGSGIDGSIMLFGTPAEETLTGKVYMARDGVFSKADKIISWHPGKENAVMCLASLAMDSVAYEFIGKSAHAAFAPFDARSALDAVETMNYAANHLREHLPRGGMLHYVITNGGIYPNVVPPYARCWYFIRAHNRTEVKLIVERLKRCAEGAAHATETELKVTTLTGVYDSLPLEAAAQIMHANLDDIPPPKFTENEKAFPKDKFGYSEPDETVTGPFVEGVGSWSTDLGNVSWQVPFSACNITCHAPETPAHHYTATEQYRMGIGQKGMLYAAKILAATALDYFLKPEYLRRVRQEWESKTKGFVYDPVVPMDQKPPKISIASSGS